MVRNDRNKSPHEPTQCVRDVWVLVLLSKESRVTQGPPKIDKE